MQTEGLDRRELLRLASLLGVLLLVTGAIVLFTQGGGAAPEQQGLEGVITSVDASGFMLRPQDGGPERRLTVAPQDARTVDIPHLNDHVRDQIPVRVVVRQEGGITYAREVIDLMPAT